MTKTTVPLHPLFFAVYPVLALYTFNSAEVPAGELIRPVAAVAAIMLISVLALRALTRDWQVAALLSSVGALLFFSYGHTYLIVKAFNVGGIVIGRHRYMLPMWGLLFTLAGLLLWRHRSRLTAVTRLMNLVGGMLFLYSAVAIAMDLSLSSQRLQGMPATLEQVAPAMNPGEERPDVYYIIVDGYAREDILADIYGIDNSKFIHFLEEQGFYIADLSHSNYNQTALSLASSLNMAYLQDLQTELGITLNDPVTGNLIAQNRVMKIFRDAGYTTIAFDSGWMNTSIQNADVYLELPKHGDYEPSLPATWGLNALEGLVVETSLARILIDSRNAVLHSARDSLLDSAYWRHRQRILHMLSSLEEIPSREGDHFVFAHLIIPHPPFVFGRNGEWVDQDTPFSLQDGSKLTDRLSRRDYIERYGDQLLYLNALLTETLTILQEQSDTPPIILLQADHGPGAYLVWESPADSDVTERTAILNALLLPCEVGELLYPGISPVNSFRVVLNACFGSNLPLLEDASYFSTLRRRFEFIALGDRP